MEELYKSALKVGPAYTELQLADRALDRVKLTGMYQQACIEWCAVNPKDWNTFKNHFTKAYKTRLESDPTEGAAGYHGAANVVDNDNDSIGTK